MKTAATGLPARRWALFGLVALLGLTIAAGGGSAVASGPGHAVAAKKCKKHKRSAGVSKKKKCKKKKKTTPTPVQLPAPGPLVRATLSWSANDEVDLHAFDSSGNHAGWVEPGVVNNIPNAHHNGDKGPFGPSESFTDDIFVSGGSTNREFSYVACLYDFPLTSSYSATFTGVTADGHSSTVSLDGPGIYSLTITGGPPVPSNPC
jgi:hypothetical protein